MTEIPARYQSSPASSLSSQGRSREHEQALLAELSEAVGAGLLIKICRHIMRAETEHPVFAEDFAGAVTEVKSELLEWESKAIVGRREDAEVEALDGITTLFRFIRRDYERAPS